MAGNADQLASDYCVLCTDTSAPSLLPAPRQETPTACSTGEQAAEFIVKGMILFYREGPWDLRSLNYLQQAGAQQAGAQAAGRTGRRPWGLHSRPGRSTSRSRCGSRPSTPPRGSDGSALLQQPQPQAGSQHLGAAQQAGAAGTPGARRRPGLHSRPSRSKAAQQACSRPSAPPSRWRWQQCSLPQPQPQAGSQHLGAAQQAGAQAAGAQQPEPHSLRGLRSRPGRSSSSRSKDGSSQLGLQPLQEARTAALRHAAASRLTALGGFAAGRRPAHSAWGLRSRPGRSSSSRRQGWQQASWPSAARSR